MGKYTDILDAEDPLVEDAASGKYTAMLQAEPPAAGGKYTQALAQPTGGKYTQALQQDDIGTLEKILPSIEAFGRETIGGLALMPKFAADINSTISGNSVKIGQAAARKFGDNLIGTQADMIAGSGEEIPEDMVKSIQESDDALAAGDRGGFVGAVQSFGDKLEKFGVDQIKKSEEIRNRFTEERESITKLARGNQWGDVTNKVAEMAIMEIPRFASQILLAFLSKGASLGYMGVSAATTKYGSLEGEGLSADQRVANALGTGVVELVSEKLGTGRVLDRVISKKIKSGAMNKVKEFAIGALGGAVSEGAAQYGENVLDDMVGMDTNLGEGIVESAIMGALFDSSVSIAGIVKTAKQTKRIENGLVAAGATEQEVADIIQSADAATTPDELNEVDKKIQEVMGRNKQSTDNDIAVAIDESRADEILAKDNISETEIEELNEIADRVPATTAHDIRTEMDKKLEPDTEAQDGTQRRSETATEQGKERVQEPDAVPAEGRTAAQDIDGQAGQEVDTTGLQEAMESDKTEQIEQAVEGSDDPVGISKRWDRFWGGLKDAKLLNPDVESHETVMKEAFSQRQHEKVDNILAKIKRKIAINKHEVGGLLIKKTQVYAQLKRISRQLAASTDDATTAQLIEEQEALLTYGDELTTAIRKAGTEIGRAASMFAVELDKDTFDIVNVMARYKANKRGDPTAEEKAKITEKVEERQELVDDLENMEYTGNALVDGILITDEVERAYRRMKKPGRKRVDKNADIKLMRSRQDEIFSLIDQINNGKPKGQKIKKVARPDSAGYLEMINNLKAELELKTLREKAFDRNVKLIDKRDAVLAEIENMHRDITEKVEKLKQSKLQSDTKKYEEARRDQDTIAGLLDELRNGAQKKDVVTKEDAHGYKQTIAELRRQLSNKAIANKLQKEVDLFEAAVAEGDVEFAGVKPEKSNLRSDKAVDALKKRKAELRDELKRMKADRDKADKIVSEATELLDELEGAHRRIKSKKEKGVDPNADLRLAVSRQDQIFDMIDKINNWMPPDQKIQKVEDPDSEGYLEMLTNLREQFSRVKIERNLDKRIADLEADIDAGDIAKYDKKGFKEEDPAILLKRARVKALGSEINRQLAAAKPMTAMGKLRFWIWDPLRNTKLAMDLGHIFRQGAFLMSNPRYILNGGMKKFVKDSFLSFNENQANRVDSEIMSHEWYSFWKAAGAPFIEEGMQLDAREEILNSGLLSRVPGFKHSGRAQLTGTNMLRLLMLESYRGGRDISMEEGRRIVIAVSILSGRGATVRDPKWNQALNWMLTSPSFTASRLQTPFILMHKDDNGIPLWKDKKLRNRVIEDYSWFIGTRIAIMGALAAALPDMDWGEDPDHWTYGRLIVDVGGGKTRVYDPWAGVASAYRALYPLATELDFSESVKKLVEGRKHPAIGSIQEVVTGKTYYGEEIERRAAALRAMLPISIDGMKEAIQEDTGVFDLLAAVSTDVMGIGSTLVDTRELNKSIREAERK